MTRGVLRAGVPGIVASPTGLAAAAASAVLVLGWRGADWPAQLYRIGLCDRDGFALWNSHWYGGHPTLTYSVLSPMVAALLSPGVLAVVSAAASTSSSRWRSPATACSPSAPRRRHGR